MQKKINVLIVDDSAVVRQVMTALLEKEPDITVIGAAADPLFAMQRMKRQWPDVILMDVEMPRMDGLTFLKKIMAERPTPVVICSSLTQRGAETSMAALSAGAMAVVGKPGSGVKRFLMEDAAAEIAGAVRAAAMGNARKMRRSAGTPLRGAVASATSQPADMQPPSVESHGIHAPNTPPAGSERPAIHPQASGMRPWSTAKGIVAVGTSTGGTQALEHLLIDLPRTAPGIVIVQHMPEKFTASFAKRLNEICQIEVREACDGDRLRPGLALIAPGGRHMLLKRQAAHYQVVVRDGPLVNRHRPSVDVLFRSVAQCAGSNALGIIMTGMGDDGARGLKLMLEAGARTLAQDEASCVVYGMPKEAVKLGAVLESGPIEWLTQEIIRHKEIP
ncbi:MAG TPA: chemotaxis response regulator protein-glutamate methylesterase [Burkholderiaceae bacterium]|nr:chemotaxis response regulator protein-glutamate methylesterase [Burkholderiaceae bacterium]